MSEGVSVTSIEGLTGPQKAAIFIIALGEDVAIEVMRELSENAIKELTQEISLTINVDPELSREVLEEFYSLTLAREYLSKGGVDYAKKVLLESVGPQRAKSILNQLVKGMESSIGFDALKNINPQQLSKIIQKEHPQTIALVLAHLDPPQAAECLASLPENIKLETVKRLATLNDISPEVLRRLSVVLEEKLHTMTTSNIEIGGIKSVAEILNRMDREASKDVLDNIAKENADLASQIRDMMFVFEDIGGLDDVAMREILKRVDKRALTVALKGASEEVKERFFSNMSSRAVETIREEMEYMGPVKLKEVEKAQRDVVDVVRRLEDEGVISLGAGAEEVLV